MYRQTQMNDEIFQENLKQTVIELKTKLKINCESEKFIIEPIVEPGKMLDSGDEMMKRMVLTPENISNKKLSYKYVSGVLGGFFPRALFWITVSFCKMDGTIAIFKLETSLRFRKPTLLRNQETGHPPFKAVINESYHLERRMIWT